MPGLDRSPAMNDRLRRPGIRRRGTLGGDARGDALPVRALPEQPIAALAHEVVVLPARGPAVGCDPPRSRGTGRNAPPHAMQRGSAAPGPDRAAPGPSVAPAPGPKGPTGACQPLAHLVAIEQLALRGQPGSRPAGRRRARRPARPRSPRDPAARSHRARPPRLRSHANVPRPSVGATQQPPVSRAGAARASA